MIAPRSVTVALAGNFFQSRFLSVLGAIQFMSPGGFSVLIVTIIGPSGDSASSWLNETWPAKATCLFRQNLMVFSLDPEKSALLEASLMCSFCSKFLNLSRGSWDLVSAIKMQPLWAVCVWRGRLPKMFWIAFLTFSSFSVGLTVVSTRRIISSIFSRSC